VAAYWSSDDALVKGSAAITINEVGKGRVIYIGGYVLDSAMPAVLDYLIPELRLKALAEASPDIEMISRQSGKKRWLALLNHAKTPQQVKGLNPGKDLLSQAKTGSRLELPGFGVALIEEGA
jgi:beta-galactosidase